MMNTESFTESIAFIDSATLPSERRLACTLMGQTAAAPLRRLLRGRAHRAPRVPRNDTLVALDESGHVLFWELQA